MSKNRGGRPRLDDACTTLIEAKVDADLAVARRAAARQDSRTISGEIRAMLRDRFRRDSK